MSGLPKRPPHEDPPPPPIPTHSAPSNKRPHEETITTTANKPVQPGGASCHPLDNSQDSARFSKAPRIENREERRPVQPPPAVQAPVVVLAPAPAHPPAHQTAHPVSTQKVVLSLPPPSSSAEHKSTKESADVAVEPVPVQQPGNTGTSNKAGTKQDVSESPTNGNNTNTTNNNNPNTNIRVSNPNPNPTIPSWGFPPVPVPPSEDSAKPSPSVPSVPPTEDPTSTTDPVKKDKVKDSSLKKENPAEKEPATVTPMNMDSEKQNNNNNNNNNNNVNVNNNNNNGNKGEEVTSGGQVAEGEKGEGGGFGGVQTQRRRQQRVARGNSGSAHREPRFRSRLRDDGLQGKGEASVIVYKAGECMQELLKSWREFKDLQKDTKNGENSQIGPSLEIRIPSEYVISTNRQVKGAQLWGTDIYTNDSDLVAVLMHMGYCSPSSSPPPLAIQELKATIRVLPPQKCYTSTLRNNVRSRAWGDGISCSYRVESCFIVKKGGDLIELEPRLQHTSGLEPTLAPVSVERTMTTRSAASNALRQQKFVREVTVQYNLCNEPWLKYSINAVADKGLKKSQYTSARLKRGEVLYLETHFNRYELSFAGEKSTSHPHPNPNSSSDHHHHHHHHQSSTTTSHHPNPNPNSHHNHQNGSSSSEDPVDSFRWTRCRKPMPEPVMRTLGIPLPSDHLEILAENLEWEEIQWSSNGVWIADKEYSLARVQFISPK